MSEFEELTTSDACRLAHSLDDLYSRLDAPVHQKVHDTLHRERAQLSAEAVG